MPQKSGQCVGRYVTQVTVGKKDGKTASERGIYKYTYTPTTGEPRTGYGQFHVFSRKEKGRWKIAVDYDSSEGGTVGEAEFKAGKRTEDW